MVYEPWSNVVQFLNAFSSVIIKILSTLLMRCGIQVGSCPCFDAVDSCPVYVVNDRFTVNAFWM